MSDSQPRKRPKRLTAIDMMDGPPEQVKEKMAKRTIDSKNLPPWRETGQVQLLENIEPSHKRSRAPPLIYMPHTGYSAEPLSRPSRPLKIDQGDDMFSGNRDSQAHLATTRGEASSCQRSLDAACEYAAIESPGTHPACSVQPFAGAMQSDVGPQCSPWNGNNDPFSTSKAPDLFLHTANEANTYFGARSQPVTFNSVMPQQNTFYPIWVSHGNTGPFSQVKNSIFAVRYGKESQESQHSHMYQHSLLHTSQYAQAAIEQDSSALGSKSTSQMQPDLKRRKFCNNYHLRGACLLGDSCRYVHGIISQAELRELRRIAKGLVCKFGLNCSDDLCYAGHKCPHNPCFSHQCSFPDEMHYDGPEETRGRMNNDVDYKHEDGKQQSSFTYRLAEPENGQQSDQHDEGLRGLHTPLLHHDEQAILMPPERNSVSRNSLQREVDELLEDFAPSKTSHPESHESMLRTSRDVSDLDLDLFEENLARGIKGSQASSSADQQQGTNNLSSSALSKTVRPESREKTPPLSCEVDEQDLHLPGESLGRRPRGNEASSLLDAPNSANNHDPAAISPRPRQRRRPKRLSRRERLAARARANTLRQEEEFRVRKMDSWRPRGDYWRPQDER